MTHKIDKKTLEKLHRDLFNNITTDGTMEGETKLQKEIMEVLENYAQG